MNSNSSFYLFRGIKELYSLKDLFSKEGRKPTEKDLSLIENAAFIVHEGKILWLGKDVDIPKKYAKKIDQVQDVEEIPLNDSLVFPGFIEAHTHCIFSGQRSYEFELRNQGLSYQEITAKGGGIYSTVRASRESSENELFELAKPRVKKFLHQGVTTLEIKSGYGLNLDSELKMLRVIDKLKKEFPISIVSTFLGAHALGPEFQETTNEILKVSPGNVSLASHPPAGISSLTEAYLKYLLEIVLPEVKSKKLSQRIDIFIEKGFFSKEEGFFFLEQAQKMGFDLVVHADQLSLSGGADLAVKLGARSADHLIKIDDSTIRQLASSSVTCVLLPAADLYMKCSYPPARALIDAGARVALATDYNPGSCPSQDLSLVGLLARLEMKMTLAEVLSAYTCGASFALGLENEVGSLEVGKKADFFTTKKSLSEFFYSVGSYLPESLYIEGKKIF